MRAGRQRARAIVCCANVSGPYSEVAIGANRECAVTETMGTCAQRSARWRPTTTRRGTRQTPSGRFAATAGGLAPAGVYRERNKCCSSGNSRIGPRGSSRIRVCGGSGCGHALRPHGHSEGRDRRRLTAERAVAAIWRRRELLQQLHVLRARRNASAGPWSRSRMLLHSRDDPGR